MLAPEPWAEIHRLRKQEHLSLGQIARQLSLDRKTVRKALSETTYPGLHNRPPSPRGSKLDPYKDLVRQYLKESPTLTAVQVLRRLKHEVQYPGEITIVRQFVQSLRHNEKQAFQRLTYLPGKVAQVDWASCGRIQIGNTHRRLSLFVMVLPYSRYLYAEYTLSERMDAFLAAHVRAFTFFGGVPSRVVYDNCKTVVLSRSGGEVRFHPRLLDFSTHYLFHPRPCLPRRPWHKGAVESAIGYCQKSLLRGRAQPNDLDRERADLNRWLVEVANTRIVRETQKRPVDLFRENEHSQLTPLPPRPYDTAHRESVSVNRFFEVFFDGNRYTVPSRLAHQKGLLLRATADEVVILEGDKDVARHTRSYQRNLRVEDPTHGHGLRMRQQRAERDILRERLAHLLGEQTDAYIAGLLRSEIHSEKHLVRILQLADRYGIGEVREALQHAMSHRAFGADYVENIVHQRRRARNAPPVMPLAGADELMQIHVHEPDLSIYQSLLTEAERNTHDNSTEQGPTQASGAESPLPGTNACLGQSDGTPGAGQ